MQARSAARAKQRNLSIAAIGLGAGTVAAYAHPGDSFRFYEINPQVIAIATNPAYFTYLADSEGSVEIVPGDARLSLEREAERGQIQSFDAIIVDAFSGDAVPVHLLTLEAFAVYRKLLRQPDGVLAIHITNTYLNLRPVVLANAAHYHLNSAWIRSTGDGVISSDAEWILLSEGALPADHGKPAISASAPVAVDFRPWTDDYSDLLGVLRR
jgi:spermidine synthase